MQSEANREAIREAIREALREVIREVIRKVIRGQSEEKSSLRMRGALNLTQSHSISLSISLSLSEVEDLVDEGEQSDEAAIGGHQRPSGVPSLEDLVEEGG